MPPVDPSGSDESEMLFSSIDARQYAEWVTLLKSRAHSSLGYRPSEALTRVLLSTLSVSRVRRRCACAQPDCNTYDFQTDAPEDPSNVQTVRFDVAGEALLCINEAGLIYSAERLLSPSDLLQTRYQTTANGDWAPVPLVITYAPLQAHDEQQ
jgi:hypothetical protein